MRKVETVVSRALLQEAIKEYLYRFKVVPERDTIVSMDFKDNVLETMLSDGGVADDQMFDLTILIKKEQEVRISKIHDS